jgi:site-specific DNA recombinase
MPSTNGHGPKRAILYARVSTDEQARTGYSLAQQLEALRDYAAREGYQVLEEVSDPGQSGASLERPGMDRVRDLVTAGGVSLVLAQDRDRFAREPAYHYLLKREFEEHGCKIRALNDRGDDTPEGDLTDGILDQLAKYEKAKIAERTRRGKLRKAREGKVIAGRAASYGRAAFGFKYNEKRDGLVLDEERILIVKQMFYMAGVEGRPIYAIKRALDTDGVPTPTGKGSGWAPQLIRRYLLSDLYKPHTFEEIRALVSPEVAATLNPEVCYGVWWWGRSRLNRRQVAEPVPNGDGRRYRYRYTTGERPKEEWIAVPVPDSGIPREWVDAARERVKNNRRPSNAGRREWELSGGILRCAECGRAMTAHTCPKPKRGRVYFYYRCSAGAYKWGGRGTECEAVKHHRAEDLEERVWVVISGLLKEPERLRVGLDAMVERERESTHGDPEAEAKLWLDKLADIDRKRARYQEMAAEDLIGFDELRARITELEETRTIAERELKALQSRQEQIRQLEENKQALLERYAGLVPDAVDALDSAERHRVYKMLRVEGVVSADGSLEVSGDVMSVCEMETLST